MVNNIFLFASLQKFDPFQNIHPIKILIRFWIWGNTGILEISSFYLICVLCVDVKSGQLEKRRKKDWKLSKCGATEE